MSTLLTMEILRVATVLSLFCFYSIFCFPSRPLNERSTELAWQAWLLVDDQNQNKHYDAESLTRRRITPKSVFIAPTFSPESLPACAEGYRPDSMGRCIKIIKLDEEAHLDFLLEKLNAQFGNYDEMDDEQEEAQTSGPFQLNIPFGAGSSEEQTKDSQDSLDIAIVVAPTNGNFGLEDNLKNNVKRTNADGNSQVKPPKIDNIPRPFSVSTTEESVTKLETNTVPFQETTTTEAPTTTQLVEDAPSTSTTLLEETTTQQAVPETTISDQHALFFLKHLTNTTHVQNGTNNAGDTPVAGNYSVVNSSHSLSTLLSNSTLANNSSTVYANDQPSTDADLMTSEALHQSIRFPSPAEEDAHFVKYPEKVTQNLLPHVNTNTYASQFQHVMPPESAPKVPQQFSSLFDEYIYSRGADLKGNERFVFKPQSQEHTRFQPHSAVFNHRNRDKHWALPPSWSESSPQKPIVLRFSRRSGNGRHLLEEHLRPHTQNSPTYYREVPSEDFSYIFGMDAERDRRRIHR